MEVANRPVHTPGFAPIKAGFLPFIPVTFNLAVVGVFRFQERPLGAVEVSNLFSVEAT